MTTEPHDDKPYPEHAKQSAVLVDARTLGEFLDWLGFQNVHLTCLREDAWGDQHYTPDPRSPQQLLADYFGIDLNAIEQEKRAMLASLRSPAEASR